MLHYTFPVYALLASGMAALPQYFISAGTMASSPLQPHPGSAILSLTTPTLQTTFTSTLTLTPTQVSVPPTPATIQAATTPPCSLQARRVPTTFTTLPNPTPSPTPASTSLDPREHTRSNEDTDDDNDDDVGPLDPKPWPKWLGPATFALVFYDALTMCAFLWLWLTGHFWWLTCFGREHGEEERLLRDGIVRGGVGARARAREVAMEREMRRMGMV